MTILSGRTLVQMEEGGRGLIAPFFVRTVSHGMTYGVGPAGYDVRAAHRMWLPARTVRLNSTIEYFRMPDNILGRVSNKSSWARLGVDAAHSTVLEPGWEGHLTLELENKTTAPIHIAEGQPIAQVIFEYLDQPAVPYNGKYQGQGIEPVESIHEM